ncbi:hypothetical protein [Anaerorhabdus sp.]|uniref:hypothetical protein n=1 Tax=Anaerorhabdus sp. TaxID=1872524 RepID=UPI002B21CE5C|nr:hypothetical protein [Anaerorhabdus sp.]MEA4875914.1 hypothetical protein [Anaerorhabdus sp.]
MSAFIVLLWIVLWNAVFVDVFNEKFEKMLPFSLISAALIVYLGGLVGSLRLGFYLTIGIILFYILYKVCEYCKNKKWNIPFQNIFTTGFVITIVVYFLILGMNWIRGFNHWDDYMHWGSMVKYNVNFDQFYSFDKSFIFAHKDYPPIASLYETIWCFLSGGYNEAYCIYAMQFLEMSFLLILFTKIKLNKENWLSILLSVFIIFTVILVLPDLSLFYYNSIYVDSLIGIIFGYSIYFVFSHELTIKNSFLLSLLCAFLILLKQIGLAFYGLIIFAIVIKVISNYKNINLKKVGMTFLTTISIPILFYLSWKFIISLSNVNGALIGQFSYGDLKVFDIFGIVKGMIGEPWQVETAQTFIEALFTRPMFYQPFKLSYVFSIILINIFLFGISYIFKNNRKSTFMKMIVFDLGAIGYAFGMLMLYVFAFGPYEGPILASFERYMATYIFAGILLIIYTIFEDFKVSWKSVGSIVLVLILFIPTTDYNRLKPSTTYYSWGDGLMQYAEMLKQHVRPGDKVLMMEQGEKAIHHYILGYYLMPIEMNAYSFGKPKYQDDIYSVEFNQKEFDELLKQYDYFYLYMFDDEGNKLLSSYLDESDIDFSRLFKIVKKQEQVQLVPVN